MKNKKLMDILRNNCPWLFVALGFFCVVLLTWFDEAVDFPHLFFGAPQTPFNWKEALIESILIAIVGFFTVLKMMQAFNRRREAEKQLLRSQKDLVLEKQKLEEVLNIDCQISSILRLNQLIDIVIEQAVKLLNAKRCSLMMIDPQNNELIIKGSHGIINEVIKSTKFSLGERISGHVARNGHPVFIKDIRKSEFANFKKVHNYKSNSFMIVPIKLHQKVVGVVNVSEKEVSGPEDDVFTDIDFKILLSIVHQAAVSIENANYYQELEYLTRTDSLTGLYNHRHFVKILDKEIARARRYKRPLSILMLDVDDFKYFNDTYGHLEGDNLLKEISSAILRVSRSTDICCRYAGDEFIIVLPETGLRQAEVFVCKLKDALKAIQYKEEVTASVGVVEYHNYKEDRLDLVRRVDQALYEAKKTKHVQKKH